MKKRFICAVLTACLALGSMCLTSCKENPTEKEENGMRTQVAAYYFPNWADYDGDGVMNIATESEYSGVINSKPRFEGHLQPRIPQLGIVDESKPEVMEKKIALAHDYGLDAWMFCWYWYKDFPGNKYLAATLDNGFLKARNKNDMKFSIFWCNHDVGTNWLYGAISAEEFEEMSDGIIKDYFSQENYWRIDGKLVFTIPNMTTFVKGVGGLKKAKECIELFRQKTRDAGYGEIMLSTEIQSIAGIDITDIIYDMPENFDVTQYLGIDNTTTYGWSVEYAIASNTDNPAVDYKKYGEDAIYNQQRWLMNKYSIPYWPTITSGWDPSPRTDATKPWDHRWGYPYSAVLVNNTPENFGYFLEKEKEMVEKAREDHRVVVIQAWNEWGEGSFLEPDQYYGYGYLREIKRVFGK